MKKILLFIFAFSLLTVKVYSQENREEEIGEPTLPVIVEEKSQKQQKKKIELPFDLTGFFETRMGIKTQSDRYEPSTSIFESRLQIEIEKNITNFNFKLTTDFLYDNVLHRNKIDLENGKGWIDLREANFTYTPFDFMDIKAGRQILTWGTGDLIFINDLFPKDWKSFFIGRDDEYLKAPSDAIKVSFFTPSVNVDVVYTPKFDSDRYIEGEKISYWNPLLGTRAGKNNILKTEKPSGLFSDSEVAMRIYKNIQGYELALYGYKGFWKSPNGINPITGKFTFPELNVYGFSVRGHVLRGIGNFEFGYYDSKDDSDGDNPFVRNSELRFLAGYEQDLPQIAKDFTIGVQYYIEHMLDYGDYKKTLFPGTPAKDKDRQVITLRVTKLLMNQNLTLSLFSYYSPSEVDAYLRPKVNYKVNDYWVVEVGGNIFLGKNSYTFFGQFEKNNNIYISFRRSF